MAKNIDWLDQFAVDQYKQLKKTASINKIAEQIIVNCSAYPNAKIGSLVDYENNKYKVIDTEYHDKSGPGILLEKVADLESPTASGEVSTKDGTVPASTTDNSNSANCGDPACGLPKTAAKEDEDILADFDDSSNEDNEDNSLDNDIDSEYPSIIPAPGGVKPIASEPITGPNKKHVTDAPYHPTFDPGEQYALDSLDEWQDAADRTLKTIEKEDSIDRTTVEGHYTWNTEIDNMLDDAPAGTPKDYDSLADFDDSPSSEDNDDDENDDKAMDEAVDSIIDTDEELSDEELPDENDSENEDLVDEEIPDSDEYEEIPADEQADDEIADEDLPDIDDEDGTDEEIDDSNIDEDLPDVDDEDEKKTASPNFSSRPISRLAYKNN